MLIDTPPAVQLPDCRIIERCVDGFLVVVAAHKTPRPLLTEALNQLDPATVVGVVFNGDDRPRARYDGYYGYSGNRSSRAPHGPWWRRLRGRR